MHRRAPACTGTAAVRRAYCAKKTWPPAVPLPHNQICNLMQEEPFHLPCLFFFFFKLSAISDLDIHYIFPAIPGLASYTLTVY